mmetsp:Transcript_113913/g.322515  ORF Transcript_113913/g.322515 Transcript_113913/m.322515 type:complete len:262 (+) Transcript_113913:141-926(+)
MSRAIAHKLVGAQHAHPAVRLALYRVGRGRGYLLHAHRGAEHAAERRGALLLQPRQGPPQAAHPEPHRLEHQPEREGNLAPVLCARHDAGLDDQHPAAAGTEARRLRVLRGRLLGHLLPLAVAGDEPPSGHRRVDEDDARNLVLGCRLQRRHVRRAVHLHRALPAPPRPLGPGRLADRHDDGARPGQQRLEGLGPQQVHARLVLDVRAELAARAWLRRAAEAHHRDVAAGQLAADGGADEAAAAEHADAPLQGSHGGEVWS